ncbi:MAG: pilus assembly protein, partial [Methylocystis sp.]|nr:pilus assembly protein [Methylocystis sp.]
MIRLRQKISHSFIDAQEGVAALEFAIAAPLLVAMMLGFVELDRYVWATRELENTATSIARMITQAPPPARGEFGSLKPADVMIAQNSVMVLFPRCLLYTS